MYFDCLENAWINYQQLILKLCEHFELQKTMKKKKQISKRALAKLSVYLIRQTKANNPMISLSKPPKTKLYREVKTMNLTGNSTCEMLNYKLING